MLNKKKLGGQFIYFFTFVYFYTNTYEKFSL